MATRLTKLNIEEQSGVENPANELPGFMVIKTKEDAVEVVKEVDAMENDFAIAYASIQAISQYTQDAPPEVTSAIGTITSWIESLFSDTGTNDMTDASTAPAEQPVAASADPPKSGGLLAKLLKREEAPAAAAAPAEKTAEPVPEAEPATKSQEETAPVTKSEDELDVAKSLGDIAATLTAMADVQKQTNETANALTETTEALKDALSGALDRISLLETGSKAVPVEEVTTKSQDGAADRGTAALRSALVSAARQSGAQITLG